jgi:hypothetical protein
MAGDDSAVQWRQATTFAIRRDDVGPDYWESGCAKDVLVREQGGLLVAAATGGVWSVERDGGFASALGDAWDNPDINCIRFGPDGDDHVFAGGGSVYPGGSFSDNAGVLYVTDPSAPAPLLAWHEITSIQTMNPRTIHSIAILRSPRRIVVACDGGLLWSEIPKAGPGSAGCLAALLGIGGPGWKDGFAWKRAKAGDGNFSEKAAMFSVAIGTSNAEHEGPPEGLNGTTVVAGSTGAGARGLFVGSWNAAGDLIMRRVSLLGAKQEEMANVSVDVCSVKPSRLYAACSDDKGQLIAVMRSDDGGELWYVCGTALTAGAVGDLLTNAGKQRAIGLPGSSQCIGVAGFDPDIVSVGWQKGPFTSRDGGRTWYQAEAYNHEDLQATYWDPRVPGPGSGAAVIAGAIAAGLERLYVCSDGGVVSTADYGQTFDGPHSRHLSILQCYSADGYRRAAGSMGAGAGIAGVVAVGTQDNSNLYAVIQPNVDAFAQISEFGDGGFNCFLGTGWALHNGGLTSSTPINASNWDAGTQSFVDTWVPPVNRPKPGRQRDPGGLGGAITSVEAVKQPAFRQDGALMFSIASIYQQGSGCDIYGLFSAGDPHTMEWRYLSSVPDYVSSVASIDGSAILIGTSTRKVYSIDPATGQTVEPYGYDASLQQEGSILRIVAISTNRLFAIHTWNHNNGDLIALRGGVWVKARSGIPSEEGRFWGLEQALSGEHQILVAATDAHVWISYDDANTWTRASQGLPVRPHCADIRFVQETDGSRHIYLATWGRSVWVADLTRA